MLEAEIESRAAQARQAGVQEGMAAAQQQYQAQLQQASERFARAVAELAGFKDRLRRQAEQDVVALALEIAQRLLHRELSTDPDALAGLVRAAVDKMDAREIHRVRTHPQHASLLETLLPRIGSPQRIEVVGDAGLELGSAIFETARGAFDASVTTQLREIENGFAEIVQRKR